MGFSGLRFWFFSKSVFRFLCQKTLWFWYSLRFADCLFFSIWLSVFVKTTNRFSDLVFEVVFRFFLFGFWFLFNLSGTFLPHQSLIAANPVLLHSSTLYRIDYGFDNWDVKIFRFQQFCMRFSVFLSFFCGFVVLDDFSNGFVVFNRPQ